MPRKPTIKWRESDAEKLTREVERFNAKIYRTRSRHPELADILPEPIKKADKQRLIEEFKVNPRSEFNKKLNELDRFSRKGAEQRVTNEQGFSTTRWERREIAYDVAQLNRERAKERARAENMEATTRGQKIGLKRGEMGSERLNELKPKKFDFDKVRNRTEFEKLKASVEKQIKPSARDMKMELFKNNYLKAIEQTYGDHAANITELVKGLPARVVVDTFHREQEASIDFHYEPQEMAFKLEILEGIWQGVSDVFGDEIHG